MISSDDGGDQLDSSKFIPHYTRVKYQKEAYNTWKNYYFPKDEMSETTNYINGTLSCFCNDEYNEQGLVSAYKNYRDDGFDQLPQELRDSDENEDY